MILVFISHGSDISWAFEKENVYSYRNTHSEGNYFTHLNPNFMIVLQSEFPNAGTMSFESFLPSLQKEKKSDLTIKAREKMPGCYQSNIYSGLKVREDQV